MEPDQPPAEQKPLRSRLGWMLLIWAASVLALGAVAFVIKMWLRV